MATDNLPSPWPPGPSEMARRIREHDWAMTPLGRLDAWPQSLRTAVELMLASGFASALYYGPDTQLLYNDDWAQMLGPLHPAALGRSSLETFAKSQATFVAHLERAWRGETLQLSDQLFPLQRGDQLQLAWVSLTYGPLRSEDGHIAGVFVVALDTTERHRVEAALRESEARQAFLLRLGDALRPLAAPLEIKGEACRLLGEHLRADRVYYYEYETADDEGREYYVIQRDYARHGTPSIAGRYRAEDFPSIHTFMGTGALWIMPDVMLHPLLTTEERARLSALDLRATIGVPLVKKGRLVAALAVGQTVPHDWTPLEISLMQETAERTWAAVEQARAEATLREREARYRTLVENVRDYAIFLLDAHGVVTEWTRGAERIKGFSAEEAVGQHVSRFYPPEDVAAGLVERELTEAATSGRVDRQGWRVRKNGTRFWSHEIATAIRDAQGQLVGFTQVTQDLSEHKRLQEQREHLLAVATAAQAQAEEANRLKDEFLATLSHELRTPLAPILLWSRALRSGTVPTQDLERALEAIVQSAEMQSRLIEDLLDLSRLKSGKLLLASRSTSVETIVRAALEVIQPGAQAKGVALELHAQPGLGSAVLDPNRFQQVLWNLLSNAVRFTPTGGQVSLQVRRHAEQLEVEVADTGQGLAADVLPQLFQRFWQADMGEKRQHTGLGIGLALCRHLIELHGGTIEAHSEGLGRGATFTVRLPWVEGTTPADREVGTDSPENTSPSLRGLRVLLVEDDAHTRDVMHWTLESIGAQVLSVRSGTQALALLESGQWRGQPAAPEVIVCDIGLPGMSGYELIHRILEERRVRGQRPIPACAVSAHAREVDRRRAIEAGFELYIAKPVRAEELVQAVEELAATASRPG